MTETESFEIVVVGSGPAGTSAVQRLLELGKSVALIDVGDEGGLDNVPDLSFDALRRSDPNQKSYLLGANEEGVPSGDIKVGSHLTPPRQYVRRRADELLPTETDGASVMQSLAWGGLGAAWGAGIATYTDPELNSIGLEPAQINPNYQAVVDRIGASGELSSIISKLQTIDAPLPIDENTNQILMSYRSRKDRLKSKHGVLELGVYPLAVLSNDQGIRKKNPLSDMDFYGNAGKSAFRPAVLLEELQSNPKLTVRKNHLLLAIEKSAVGKTILICRSLSRNQIVRIQASTVFLAAGAINTARVLLNSNSCDAGSSQPLLSNPYRYWVMLNLPRIGRASSGPRHSLAQLFGLFRDPSNPMNEVSLSFYSYRSLMLFKLVREFPMPAFLGTLLARLLVNSLVIVGVHERGTGGRIRLEARDAGAPAKLRIEGPRQARKIPGESRLLRALSKLGLIRLTEVHPPWGSSIHYAGSVPRSGTRPARFSCTADFEVEGFPGVFLADSSGWSELPAKGLTLTLMAHARALVDRVVGRGAK